MSRAGKSSSRRRKGSVIVISAPSGSGKSTLVKNLTDSDRRLVFSVSHTTRPKRAGEKNGREYFFVSPEKFKRMIAAKEFAEWANVHGYYYGTSRKQVRRAQAEGKDVLLDIDVQGHGQVKRSIPDAIGIFLLPPSFQELSRRLRARHSDSPAVIRRRLLNARREMQRWREYDFLIVNDRLANATRALRAVVEAARARREVQQEQAKKILKTFGGKVR